MKVHGLDRCQDRFVATSARTSSRRRASPRRCVVGYQLPTDAILYSKIINGQLSLDQVAALDNADQRSIALSYMTFEQLVTRHNAVLLDLGVRGTALYCLRSPGRIARDRVREYGGFDYFIHMRDASHPEREFIQWVDPKVGARGDAELCQARAFGITLAQWLSIERTRPLPDWPCRRPGQESSVRSPSPGRAPAHPRSCGQILAIFVYLATGSPCSYSGTVGVCHPRPVG